MKTVRIVPAPQKHYILSSIWTNGHYSIALGSIPRKYRHMDPTSGFVRQLLARAANRNEAGYPETAENMVAIAHRLQPLRA